MVQNIPAETESKPLAILFTNADGRVVFANRNFLRLTQKTSSRTVAGERLEAILQIEPRAASKIVSIIMYTGFINKLPMSILSITGETLPVLFTGIAAYDGKRNYIGADIFLHEQVNPIQQNNLGDPAEKRTGVLKTYVNEIFSCTRAQGNTYMQAYVIAQVEILQVLLARLGGPEARNTLERILNEITDKNGIPAHMQNGYLEFTQKSVYVGVYRIILQAALEYATNAIGYRIVNQEIEKVDSNIDPGLFQLLTQMDLRPTLRFD